MFQNKAVLKIMENSKKYNYELGIFFTKMVGY